MCKIEIETFGQEKNVEKIPNQEQSCSVGRTAITSCKFFFGQFFGLIIV